MGAPRSALFIILCGATLSSSACAPQPGEAPQPTSQIRQEIQVSLASAPHALRQNHTATLLPDGTVFLAGGSVGDTAVRSTELFDARTGAFNAGPDLAVARAHHTATLLREGRVLLCGGAPGETECELYDPTLRTLVPGPSLTSPRTEHTATLLDDGRVLLVGGYDPVEPTGPGEIYDPAEGEFTSIEAGIGRSGHAAALLADGRVFLHWGSGPTTDMGFYDVETDTLDPLLALIAGAPTSPTALALPSGDMFMMGIAAMFGFYPPSRLNLPEQDYSGFPDGGVADNSVTLLPNGKVLTAGGFGGFGFEGDPYFSSTVWEHDPLALTSVPAGNLSATRSHHTATLLPTGSVFVVGGGAGSDLLVPAGGFSSLAALSLKHSQSSAVTLADGRVLVLEGAGARLFEPTAQELVATGALIATARTLPAATLLPNGKVLLAGGYDANADPLSTTELFDPSADSGAGAFEPGPALGMARAEATATLLPDGRVLVAGGYLEDGSPSDTFELADAALESFGPPGDLASPRARHAASLLLDGRVLLAGGVGGEGSAETFDPQAEASSLAAALNQARHSPTATLLPSGRVLIAGGTDLVSFVEQFHPDQDAFVVGPAVGFKMGHAATLLSSGRVLLAGGFHDATYAAGASLFDPGADSGRGTFAPVPMQGRQFATAAWLHSGGALVANGSACSLCPNDVYDLVWSDGALDEARPVLDSAPAEVVPGSDVAIEGSNFRGWSESSNGRTNASPTNYPIAVWRPLAHGGVVYGSLRDWSTTSATWRVPATALHGPGLLSIAVNGALSDGVPVTISAAPLGVVCNYAAECASGFCVDGVCCDGACDGACEACNVERKGSGEDGQCGSVPPERFADDLCALGDGAACASAEQCVSGHCTDGVCCNAECSEQCEACDVEGNFGQCVAVRGAPHGEREACSDGGDEVCASRLCDGAERASCEGFVGDEVQCDEARCLDRDRLRPARFCSDGSCEAQDNESCAPYACRDDACVTGLCSSPDDCHSDYTCAIATGASEGQCVLRNATSCVEEHLLRSADGTTVDCAPYRCDDAGACLSSCRSSLDCTRGNACSSDGRCMPDGGLPARGSVGCGCRVAGGSERAGWWTLLALAALNRKRRRRTAAAG